MFEPRIIKVNPMDMYKLKLRYETGEVKVFDVAPYITGAWFGELADASYFKSARIVNNGEGIEWPNGQDIAPHELYDESVSLI